MSYYQPPTFQQQAVVTNATAGTVNSNVQLLPAPGVGFALRIVGFHATCARQNTGAGNLFPHAAGGGSIGVVGVTAGSGDTLPMPEPGWQLPANTALQCDNVATIASMTIYCALAYFIDQVS